MKILNYAQYIPLSVIREGTDDDHRTFNPIIVNYEKLHALNPVLLNVQWIFFSAAAKLNESVVIALIFN